MKGRVEHIRINKMQPKKCYGFICGEDGHMYYFSPANIRAFQVGSKVEFSIGQDEKGYYAWDIKIIS